MSASPNADYEGTRYPHWLNHAGQCVGCWVINPAEGSECAYARVRAEMPRPAEPVKCWACAVCLRPWWISSVECWGCGSTRYVLVAARDPIAPYASCVVLGGPYDVSPTASSGTPADDA